MAMTPVTLPVVESVAVGAPAAASLRRHYDELAGRIGELTHGEFVDDATAATLTALPGDVVRALLSLRDVRSFGALMVTGLPLDDPLPPTPTAHTPGLQSLLPVARAALYGITRLLGEPFAFRDEFGGDLIGHVLPTRDGTDAVSSHGSRRPLPFHTETAHVYPFSPDFLALLCIRGGGPDGPRTRLASAADISRLLPAQAVQVLGQPLFAVRAPLSFGPYAVGSSPVAVFTGPPELPQICAELTDMVPLTVDAADALEAVREAADRVAIDVALESGQLLVIDNRKLLHGRTAFNPELDGSARWCLRTLLRCGDLWSSRRYLCDYRRLAR